METKSKLSSARRNATKKYRDANMTKVTLSVQFAERDAIADNAKKYNLPKARYIRNCVKYCINHGINIKEQIENGKGI